MVFKSKKDRYLEDLEAQAQAQVEFQARHTPRPISRPKSFIEAEFMPSNPFANSSPFDNYSPFDKPHPFNKRQNIV